MVDIVESARLANPKNAGPQNRLRQDKRTPLLIRDDGMLFPNVPLVAKRQRFRPYHGNPKASLQDRMRYLKGLAPKRQVTYEEVEEPFDLAAASFEELNAFAAEQYGMVLDPSKPLKTNRRLVYERSMQAEGDGDDHDGADPTGGTGDDLDDPATAGAQTHGLGLDAGGEGGDGGEAAHQPAQRARRTRGRSAG